MRTHYKYIFIIYYTYKICLPIKFAPNTSSLSKTTTKLFLLLSAPIYPYMSFLDVP
nr:MAG TPA: hypothetical protein [Caudoviricetes sp.]